jgi:hypothetical protein
MRIRNIVAGIATAITIGISALAITGTSAPAAHASGSTIETITETKTMVSTNCYETVKRDVTYYTHSVTKGWVREASPKVVTTHSETCDK